MKKLIISIIFALGFGIGLNAQSDGFFTSNYSYREDIIWDVDQMPLLPGSHGYLGDYDCVTPSVPLGSGILVLAGLGLTYALRRNKK